MILMIAQIVNVLIIVWNAVKMDNVGLAITDTLYSQLLIENRFV